jgi:DNA primase
VSESVTYNLTPSEIAAYYAARAPHLKQRGHEWRGACPIHEGKDDNFAVNPENGTWYCHSRCGRGGSIYDLEMALSATDFRSALEAVQQFFGRPDQRSGRPEPSTKWGLLPWQHQHLQERIPEGRSRE